MGKARKSVRKFAQKHLKSAIALRRKLKPMKKALRRKEAALAERRKKALSEEDGSASKAKKVEDMDVDELMSGGFLDVDEDVEEDVSGDDGSDDETLPEVEGEETEDFIDITPDNVDDDSEDSDDDTELKSENKKLRSEVGKHKMQLAELKKKDPEFYEYLKEHDQDLLEFEEDELEEKDDDDAGTVEPSTDESSKEASATTVLSSALIDSWCSAAKDKQHMKAVRNILSAFRSACHYGEEGNDLSNEYNIINSRVFNKVMVFTLAEIDGVFRKMLNLPTEKPVSRQDIQRSGRWKKLLPFVKNYLINALHVLNQMTDTRMLCFTLRRLKPSIIFLVELPSLTKKYLKALLHFWATGEDALPFIAFTFIQDMALLQSTNFLESCLRALYKQYVANTKFINAGTLARAQFMANCIVELYGIDTAVSYQAAFTCIRQMAIILRNALTMKSKDAFRKVYCWQFMSSLQLWVKVISAHSRKDALGPLAYPLAQIAAGVARLVPTARYFPLRMQCIVLLNELARATDTFVPVASLLLDMLEFKELHKPPTGGVGRAIDFQLHLKVPKVAIKTRAFQEECVATVMEQLTEHLAQWSYGVAFPELALVPVVQLRRFMKQTNVDRFRRQAKQLVDQVQRNIEFVTKKRDGVSFSPKDMEAVASFLKAEQAAGASPLTQYRNTLRDKSKERKDALVKPSVNVKEIAPVQDGDDNEAATLFNNKWLQEKSSRAKDSQVDDANEDANEDVIADLELSSDDEEDEDEGEAAIVHSSDEDADIEEEEEASNKKKKKKKQQQHKSKGKHNFSNSRKRKLSPHKPRQVKRGKVVKSES